MPSGFEGNSTLPSEIILLIVSGENAHARLNFQPVTGSVISNVLCETVETSASFLHNPRGSLSGFAKSSVVLSTPRNANRLILRAYTSTYSWILVIMLIGGTPFDAFFVFHIRGATNDFLPNTSSQILFSSSYSPLSMLMTIAPSSLSRSLASSRRGYIMLHQSEWKRPLDSGLATRRPPSSS